MTTATIKPFAVGTTLGKGIYKIFHGSAAEVKNQVKQHTQNKYWSIYYYDTQEQVNEQVAIDREFLADDMGGVEFVEVS